jgi:hypothetical protein
VLNIKKKYFERKDFNKSMMFKELDLLATDVMLDVSEKLSKIEPSLKKLKISG